MSSSNLSPTYSHCTFYPDTNEQCDPETLPFLDSSPKGGTYFGVSGMQNYALMAQLEATDAILGDINETTCNFHRAIQAAFSQLSQTSDTDEVKREFAQKLLQELDARKLILPAGFREKIQKIQLDWLNNTQHFLHVKAMFDNGRVEILNLNIASSKLITCLEVKNPTAIYISNVADWLMEKLIELNALNANLQQLAAQHPGLRIIYSDGTLQIDETTRTMSYHPIVRKVSVGYRDDLLFTAQRMTFIQDPSLLNLVKKFQTILDTASH